MGRERDLQSAAQRRAVDGGDHRLAQRLEAPQLQLELAHHLRDLGGVLLLGALEVVEIAAREERLLGRRDDHARDRVLLRLQALDRGGHRGLVGLVHRVRRLVRVVEDQVDDAVGVLLPANRVGHQTRSTTVAMPMPPPMHSVARPERLLVRSSSSISVPRIIPPVAPSGWPIAIAPPLTLTRSRSMSMSRAKRRTTAANASFISIRSMSSIVRPALARAFFDAGAGPVSMIVGSAPLTAVERMRARARRPSSEPVFSLPIVR